MWLSEPLLTVRGEFAVMPFDRGDCVFGAGGGDVATLGV